MYELFVVFSLLTPSPVVGVSSQMETMVSVFQFEDVCETAAATLRGMAESRVIGDTKTELIVTAACVRKTP